MSTEVEVKFPAGPERAPDATARPSRPLYVYFADFMLEDYIDAVQARASLEDPANAERVPWDQLKERLEL
jgi:hypothetical protein